MELKMKIRWIGQGGYLLSDGITTVCIDPYLSDAVERVSGKKRLVKAPFRGSELAADAVICTHDHLDHVDKGAIPEMCTLPFLAPTSCEETLRSLGVVHYTPFDEGTSVKIGEFEVISVFADHTVPAVGVIVKHQGLTLYFTGDTYYNEKLIHPDIDILFVCINGRLGNMSCEEAVRLAEEISPRAAVPTHYGMFAENTEDPKRFTSALKNGFEMEYNKEYDCEAILCLI